LMDASGYAKGIGRIRLRAVIQPKEHLAGTLVIRELPAGTTTDSLIASIEDAVRKKKLRIKSIDDFTAENVEIEIKLSPGEDAEKTIAALYLFTECEQALSARPVIIRGDRPVELDVEEVLRVNTEQLVGLLKAELELRRDDLTAGIHQKTLAQIFIENRIYKNIERCRSAEAVHSAVLDGVNRYREQLRRDVSGEDVEMLLGLRIRRISLFDISQNQREIDDLVAQLAEAEKNLKGLTRYAINYLKNLLKTYGKDYPRRTRVTAFAEADARELAVKNLAIAYDPVRGYLGYGVKGEGLEPAFRCSELDRILIVSQDGRYKVVPPPEKLFVDRDLFHFGGTILNKEYRCAPLKSRLALLTPEPLERLYIKYKPLRPKRPGGRQPRSKEALQPDEQVEELAGVPIQTPKTLGLLISHKPVEWIRTPRPRGWNESGGPANGELGL
jgi:topoisomerase-4 subunit A